MELENNKTNMTYITLLLNSLKKKKEVLERLTNITKQQEGIINAEKFNEEQFMIAVAHKDEQLQNLTNLDRGFEQIFNRVREELKDGREKYRFEILGLQDYIAMITDLSIKLQALEKRNKASLEILFSNKRKDIKNARLSSHTVTNYYKSMERYHKEQSFFYDKKN